jgi:tRNA G18 (ribose-2'-O)-methylase SpoU
MDSLGRNVIDKYSGWMTELIKEDLQKNALPYAVAVQYWKGDFNIGSALRNSNAFGASEFFYIGGAKKMDPRGAVGTQYYSKIKYLPTINELKELKSKYVFIGIENNINRVCYNIKSFSYPKNSLFIFGEENGGLTEEVMDLCDKLVYIDMLGSVRSLNCGCASAIVLFDYVNKFKDIE